MKTPKVILRIETSRACGRGILLGISKYCHLFSPWRLSQKVPFYLNSSNSVDDPTLPENWMADGMIVARPEIPEAIRQIGLPIIGIDVLEPLDGLPNIVGDANVIAEMAFKYFLDRGFSQLAYCQFRGIPWAIERGVCFATCAQKQGIEVVKHEVKNAQGRFSWDDELYAIGSWLGGLPRPPGLLACNDDCSKLVSAACESAGIRVPDDVAILGVDDDEMVCLPNDPTLSSIALDFEKAGFEAAGLLDRLMKGEEELSSQEIILQPSHVVTRQSTDILAVSDSGVASALKYIRENIHKSLGVPEVVEATALSRRGLEYRFRKVLGRSINNVIRGLRVEYVSRMLVETDLSIAQIAYKLGFTDSEHIARYFRNEKQMSPSEFRKKYGKGVSY